MKEIEITIDGRKTIGHEGMTILEVAEQVGIAIPTLCHIQGLNPIGVCRICVVEVEGSNRLVGACHTPIVEGMVIDTRSRKVISARKITLELMIAAHTGPCVVDPNCEHCNLHKMSAELELSPPRFQLRQPRFYPIEEISPYVRRDLSKCILCYRCIKACKEIAKKEVYSMGYRGFLSKVIVDCDEPINKPECRDCGVCIDYCPTSALGKPKGFAHTNEKPQDDLRSQPTVTLEADSREKILETLKEEQEMVGFISMEAIKSIAHKFKVSTSEVYGIATFYYFLSTKQLGRNVIRVCKSLPCYLKDSQMIIRSVQETIGIKPGETTPDGRFSFLLTNCIGACDQAPAMLVNHDVYGHLTPAKISDILKAYS